MELYLLRHAIAVAHGTPGYEGDSDRPLTAKGALKMEQIARGMQTLDLSFDLILSSPFPRARQTAEIVAQTFGREKKLRLTAALQVGANPRHLIDEIAANHSSFDSILLVGHEPYLSGLVSTLCVGDPSLIVTMKKGGLCRLSVGTLTYGRCATLEWLMTPRQLTRIQ